MCSQYLSVADCKQFIAGYRKDLVSFQRELSSFEETAQERDRLELLGKTKDEEVVFIPIYCSAAAHRLPIDD